MFGDDTKIKIVFTKKVRTDKTVKTTMKLGVPLMARRLLNIQATVSFSVNKKNQLDVTFVFFISLLLVAQHVSGNHVAIIRS